METISVINQKGGVAKTTSALALGTGLRSRGYKVLFIDLDAQCNLSYSLGMTGQPTLSAVELLSGDFDPSAIKADLIKGDERLSSANMVLTDTGKEYRLKEALKKLQDKYDYCIIDTPPSLGILTVNALTASQSAIVPAQADFYSLQGIGQLVKTINSVKKYCNSELKIKGILLTRYNARTILSRDLTEVLKKTAEQLETKLFNAKIRECTAVKEAQGMRQDVSSYAPQSNAALDYKDFVKEYIKSK